MKSLFKYLSQRLPFFILVIVLGCLICSNTVGKITYWLLTKSILTRSVVIILAVLSTIIVVRNALSKSDSADIEGK